MIDNNTENGCCTSTTSKRLRMIGFEGGTFFTSEPTLAEARQFLRKKYQVDIIVLPDTSHLKETWYYRARILRGHCYQTEIGLEDTYEECEELAIIWVLDNIIKK